MLFIINYLETCHLKPSEQLEGTFLVYSLASLRTKPASGLSDVLSFGQREVGQLQFVLLPCVRLVGGYPNLIMWLITFVMFFICCRFIST